MVEPEHRSVRQADPAAVERLDRAAAAMKALPMHAGRGSAHLDPLDLLRRIAIQFKPATFSVKLVDPLESERRCGRGGGQSGRLWVRAARQDDAYA